MKQLISTLQFKLTLGYTVILLALVAALSFAIQGRLEAVLEQQTLETVESKGAAIVAELQRRQTLVHTLTQSLASFAKTANGDADLIRKGFPSIVNLSGSEKFIAGGGFWPEPYAVDPSKERASLFWGRAPSGELEFYDDYNVPTGPGYHNEEWYVPARHLQDGRCYWSQSYTDPYSGQPMVTCTVAVTSGNEFKGATTVDLRLEGLEEFIQKLTQGSDSYAFLVDQHNRFITYPNNELVSNGGDSRLTSEQLGKFSNDFLALADVLKTVRSDQISAAKSVEPGAEGLANSLEGDSYQVDDNQAAMIATALLTTQNISDAQNPTLARITLEDDLIFKEAATAHVFHVPEAYWKVVVVTKNRPLFQAVGAFIANTLWITLLPLLGIMVIAFLSMRRMLILPLQNITKTLKQAAEVNSDKDARLDDSRDDELGQLAYWYNLRTKELSETLRKLSSVNDELTHEANYDYLTDLTSRRQFERRLQQLIETQGWSKSALLYLDLDQFKVINDTCGHVAGDQLLIKVGDCLSQYIREGDLLARIGGDEFAFVLDNIAHDETRDYASNLLNVIQDLQFDWAGKSFPVTCSIGIVHLADVEKDAQKAMRYVDNACYTAKDEGRNRWYMYAPDTGVIEKREGEMNWLAQINAALDQDSFFAVFQPIWPTQPEEGMLPGMEALIRLRMPDGSVVPPGAFMPAAERYGAVANIDRWMINRTLKELAEHPKLLAQLRFCSINLSAAFICQSDMLSTIRHLLIRYNLPPEKICFEVTENQLMTNLAHAKAGLKELRRLGCQVALDDFGTGMSSYSYLRELPIDHIKIDGYFVKNITEDDVQCTFVKSIREISDVMGLETIAEFVETDEIYGMLREIGVTYAQGYGIAMPMEIDKLIEFLDSDELNRLRA
ncbi:MAG: EAL domain-containing protein [Gammaproteobacteria bacterium]|nr:EAL domain-containing protein [Gammaproteobacteria bacterium]